MPPNLILVTSLLALVCMMTRLICSSSAFDGDVRLNLNRCTCHQLDKQNRSIL